MIITLEVVILLRCRDRFSQTRRSSLLVIRYVNVLTRFYLQTVHATLTRVVAEEEGEEEEE